MREYFQDPKNLAIINNFDLKDIEKKGIQEDGVSLSDLLTEVLQMNETEFKSKIEIKFNLVYKGDAE